MNSVPKKRERGEDSLYFNEQRQCWVAQYNTTVEGVRVRKSTSGETEQEAMQKLQLAKREWLRQGRAEKKSKITFALVMERMLGAIHGTVQDKTFFDYEYRASILLQYPFSQKKIDCIGRPVLQQSINKMAEDKALCASTCSKLIAFVKRVFRFAMEERLLSHNPVQEKSSLKIPIQAIEEQNVLPLSSGECDALLLVLEGSPRFKPIVLCMLLAGLRICEVLALTWDKIDFEEQIIHISRAVKKHKAKSGAKTKNVYRIGPPKTKAAVRTVQMSAQLAGCLRYWQNT